MKIVRKLLTPDEISPANTRYNPDTDTVQITPDGGTTWADAPDLDPRHADSSRRPPLSGGDAQCDAAARMVAQLQVTVTGYVAATSLVAGISTILAIILILMGGIGGILYILVPLFFEALDVIGADAIIDAFTSDVWDGILCIIYNHIDADGQMSAAQLADIMTDINVQYPGTVYNVLYQLRGLYGEVQLSNAGVTRTETGDCSACAEWCLTHDFAIDDGGFDIVFGGVYDPGFGWRPTDITSGNDYRDLEIAVNLGVTAHVTKLEMLFDYTKGTFDSGSFTAWGLCAGLGSPYDNCTSFDADATSDGDDLLFALNLDNDIDQIFLELVTSTTVGGGFSGSALLKQAYLHGTGDVPTISGWVEC